MENEDSPLTPYGMIPFLWFPLQGPLEKFRLAKLNSICSHSIECALILLFAPFSHQHHLQTLTVTVGLFRCLAHFRQPAGKAEGLLAARGKCG